MGNADDIQVLASNGANCSPTWQLMLVQGPASLCRYSLIAIPRASCPPAACACPTGWIAPIQPTHNLHPLAPRTGDLQLRAPLRSPLEPLRIGAQAQRVEAEVARQGAVQVGGRRHIGQPERPAGGSSNAHAAGLRANVRCSNSGKAFLNCTYGFHAIHRAAWRPWEKIGGGLAHPLAPRCFCSLLCQDLIPPFLERNEPVLCPACCSPCWPRSWPRA